MYNKSPFVKSGDLKMKFVAKFKVINHKPKSDISYPLIRLPQEYAILAGKTAYIYKLENKNGPLFLISFDENIDVDRIVQQMSNVLLGKRVEELERKVQDLERNLQVRDLESNLQYR